MPGIGFHIISMLRFIQPSWKISRWWANYTTEKATCFDCLTRLCRDLIHCEPLAVFLGYIKQIHFSHPGSNHKAYATCRWRFLVTRCHVTIVAASTSSGLLDIWYDRLTEGICLSEFLNEFGLDALEMIEIVLVREQILQIPQWVLNELFATPMDIVDFICDKVGVFWIHPQRFSACPENKPFLFLHIALVCIIYFENK